MRKTEDSARIRRADVVVVGGGPPADADPLRDWILEEDTSISGTVNFWVPFKGNQGMDDMIAEFNTVYCAGTYVFSHVGIATGCQDVDAAWAFTKWYATYGSKYLAIAGHAAVWKGTENDDLVSLIFGSEEEAAKLIDVESFKRVVGRTELPTMWTPF